MNEDENGHALDPDGKLVYDPRCYYCLNDGPRQAIAYVKVEIDADGGS